MISKMRAADISASQIDWQALRHPLTDLDVSREFANAMQGKLIYTDGQGWLAWEDNLWRPGEHIAVLQIEKYIDEIRNEGSRGISSRDK